MKKVCIVGAGLVGSLLSVYLSKRGYQVDVFEKRSDMRKAGFIGGRSINLALSDRGWRALKGVGLDDKIAELGLPLSGRMIHDMQSNTNFQPYGKEGQAIYSISRGQLNLELVNATEPDPLVQYYFDQQCMNVNIDEGTIQFRNRQTNEIKDYQYDLIFGADGAYSAVRSTLQKSGRFNYEQFYLEHGYKELTIPAAADGSHQISKEALHIWPRKRFMLIALPNLDGSFTCTLFIDFEGPNSFEKLQSKEEVETFFNHYFPDVVPLIPNLAEDYFEFPESSLVTIKCSPWNKGNVILLGDASHAIVPFYGQGMNSGFEDCTILNELIDEYKEDWSKIPSAFSDTRKPNADAISDLAMRNFIEMRDSVADEQFLLRKAVEKQMTKHFPDDYMPLYSMVTFSQKPYSEALNTGKKQDILFKEILSIDNIEQMVEEGIAPLQLKEWINKVDEINL